MKNLLYILTLIICVFSLVESHAQGNYAKYKEDNFKVIDNMIHFYFDLDEAPNQANLDVSLTVLINERELRLIPGTHAISGDVGKVKPGKKKVIIWDALEDVTRIDGVTKFSVKGIGDGCPTEPKTSTDLGIGGTASALGVGAGLIGLTTLLKKGKVDNSATQDDDPITYYYTFCDATTPSANFNSELVILDSNNESACDRHLEEARAAYSNGQILAGVGTALLVGGLYMILKKPIHKGALLKYKKDNEDCVILQPSFDIQSSITRGNPRAVIGVQLRYQFGK